MSIRNSFTTVGLLIWATASFGADSNAGKVIFRQQCALCHSAQPDDNGGAQGPDLHGVFGRAAASNSDFTYTPALRASKLTWNDATLDRFLNSPTTVVPGSAMVIPVPKRADRQNLIAYFRELKNGTFREVATAGRVPPPNVPLAADAPVSDPDWKKDAPGRAHRIDVAQLPAPFATSSSRYRPKVIDKPADAKLSVPDGFKVEVFASGLQAPRTMRVAPNGDIFVTETAAGRIKVMHPSANGATAASIDTFAQGLIGPFGIQFYPAGNNPQWLYVAENNRVVRYAYKVGDSKATGVPEVIVHQLYPGAVIGHSTRDIAFSPDGKRMFVSVGSASNYAEEMPKKTVAQAQTWEKSRGLGAAWDNETNRAAVLVFELTDGKASAGKLFATGIRNCVGLTIQPGSGDLWCTTNERDALGDNLVPDYSTRVKEGGYYGWPWYYLGNHEEPRLKGERPDLAGKAIMPDLLYQAHSAALTLAFYTATSGASAFPKEYVGDGFAALHGSWNRAQRTGEKVVRVRMKDGLPTGEYDDFLVGFIADADNVWGRPVGLAVAADGSLLVSEDGNNVVYRISYAPPPAAAPPAPHAGGPQLLVPGERVFPESLTSTADGRVFFGSLGTKNIYRAAPGAKVAEPWITAGTAGMLGILGVFADEKSNTLWACSVGPPGPPAPGVTPPPSVLHAFNLKTGAAKAQYPLPTSGAVCNDIAIGRDGTIYASDTGNMEVVRLKKGAKQLDVWAGNGAFGPKGGVLDGIAILGDRVFANTLATSKLFGVAIERSGQAGAVVEIKLDRPISRPDGMRSFGKDSLLLVEGGAGRLSRVTISGDSGAVTTLSEGYPDGATAVTVVGNTAWVLEAQLAAMRGPATSAAKPFIATGVIVGKP